MNILIDNFDSFTFNLFQLIQQTGATCHVFRNNEISLCEIKELAPARIFISPGPGHPSAAGITLPLIKKFAGRIPIFGVCLGHQAIAQAFGARIRKAPQAKHGIVSKIHHDKKGIFQNLPSIIQATRYHSLEVAGEDLPECLDVTCRSEDGVIMGLRHKRFLIESVQFHPESIATEFGKDMIEQFIHRGSL